MAGKCDVTGILAKFNEKYGLCLTEGDGEELIPQHYVEDNVRIPILDIPELCGRLQDKYDKEWESRERKDRDVDRIKKNVMQSALAAGIDKGLIEKQLATLDHTTLVDVPRLLDYKNIPALRERYQGQSLSSSVKKPAAAALPPPSHPPPSTTPTTSTPEIENIPESATSTLKRLPETPCPGSPPPIKKTATSPTFTPVALVETTITTTPSILPATLEPTSTAESNTTSTTTTIVAPTITTTITPAIVDVPVLNRKSGRVPKPRIKVPELKRLQNPSKNRSSPRPAAAASIPTSSKVVVEGSSSGVVATPTIVETADALFNKLLLKNANISTPAAPADDQVPPPPKPTVNKIIASSSTSSSLEPVVALDKLPITPIIPPVVAAIIQPEPVVSPPPTTGTPPPPPSSPLLRFGCGPCFTTFATQQELTSHWNKVHPTLANKFILEPAPRCMACLKIFPSSCSDLTTHVQQGKKECSGTPAPHTLQELANKLRRCPCCSTVYDSMERASLCLAEQHNRIRCYLCLAMFSFEDEGAGGNKKNLLGRHTKDFHCIKGPDRKIIYPCRFCPAALDNNRLLVEHLVEAHYDPCLKAQDVRNNAKKDLADKIFEDVKNERLNKEKDQQQQQGRVSDVQQLQEQQQKQRQKAQEKLEKEKQKQQVEQQKRQRQSEGPSPQPQQQQQPRPILPKPQQKSIQGGAVVAAGGVIGSPSSSKIGSSKMPTLQQQYASFSTPLNKPVNKPAAGSDNLRRGSLEGRVLQVNKSPKLILPKPKPQGPLMRMGMGPLLTARKPMVQYPGHSGRNNQSSPRPRVGVGVGFTRLPSPLTQSTVGGGGGTPVAPRPYASAIPPQYMNIQKLQSQARAAQIIPPPPTSTSAQTPPPQSTTASSGNRNFGNGNQGKGQAATTATTSTSSSAGQETSPDAILGI